MFDTSSLLINFDNIYDYLVPPINTFCSYYNQFNALIFREIKTDLAQQYHNLYIN